MQVCLVRAWAGAKEVSQWLVREDAEGARYEEAVRSHVGHALSFASRATAKRMTLIEHGDVRDTVTSVYFHYRPLVCIPSGQPVCGASMSGYGQNDEPVQAGPCVLPYGHTGDDGRPDSHTDGQRCWGGE